MTRRLLWIGLALALVVLAIGWFAARDRWRSDPSSSTSLAPPKAAEAQNLPSPAAPEPAAGVATPQIPDGDARTSATSQAPVHARGTIVDSRRFPVAGADVRLVRDDGSILETKSDAHGEFDFTIAQRPRQGEPVQLWAWRETEAALAGQYLIGSDTPDSVELLRRAPSDVSFGKLVLLPARPLRVEVVSAGHPVPDARVTVRTLMPFSPLFVATTDATAHVVTPPLPQGCFDVSAAHEGLEGLQRAFLVEDDDIRIALVPPFVAEVMVVDKQSGLPIAGASVKLEEQTFVPAAADGNPDNRMSMGSSGEMTSANRRSRPTSLTDESGVARFPGLRAPARYIASATAVGYGKRRATGSRAELTDAKASVRLELEAAGMRTVRFAIAAGEVTLPAGTKITLRDPPGHDRFLEDDAPMLLHGVVRGEEVIVEWIGGSARLLGTAEDGSMASFWVDEGSEIGRAVSFRKARNLEVFVRDEVGAPVARVKVQATDPGNMPLGPFATTDANGRALMRGLYGDGAVVVLFTEPPLMPGRIVAGNVDLANGDGKLEYVLSSSRLEARVTLQVLLDGAAALPESFAVRTEQGCTVLEERPERGELELRLVRPPNGEDARIFLRARGCVSASAVVHLNDDDTPVRATVEVARGTTLVAHVLLDEGQRAQVSLQLWQAGDHPWGGKGDMTHQALTRPNGANGSFRFGPLAIGRYRLRDGASTLVSDEFEISAGAREFNVDFDLRGVEWVSGRVEAPEGSDLSRAIIQLPERAPVSGTTFLHLEEPAVESVAQDGSFRFRVRRGQRTRLVVWHPSLAAAHPGGSTEVDGAREGIVLRLVEGGELRMAVPQLCPVQWARLAVYAGSVHETPIALLRAPWNGGELRFRGVPRGRYTLWIDPGDAFAPLILQDVVVGEGTTDLGTADFPRGSALTLRKKDGGGSSARKIFLRAVRDEPPALERWTESNGDALVKLSGLDAGTYRVTWGAAPASNASSERTIIVDGTNDIELEPD
ncbi:MAG TPA: hypothetical protein VM509_07750 [Planctomycetota bacterium]|nr:hypothetical protein [Planctomycetota bacterium]